MWKVWWVTSCLCVSLAAADIDYRYQDGKCVDAQGREGRNAGLVVCGSARSADLQGADLRNRDLRGADLSGARLQRADLRGTNLSGARLNGAALSDAQLEDTHFDGADLSDVEMRGFATYRRVFFPKATLSRAKLSGNHFVESDFRAAGLNEAYLPQMVFEKCHFDGADFTAARMGRVKFTGVSFAGAIFARTNLIGADLSLANLAGNDLRGARLDQAQLKDADLSVARLQGAVLIGSSVGGLKLTGSFLDGADLSGLDLTAHSFEKRSLIGTRFRRSKLGRVSFANAILSKAVFDEASLEETYFAGADLRGASLAGVVAAKSDFSSARIAGATLARGDFRQSVFRLARGKAADFRNSRLAGSDFSEARMNGADFSGAKADTAVFRATRLRSSLFVSASLNGADFSAADLEGADLSKAVLNDAIAEKASLRQARLRGAVAERFRLPGAILESADLSEANLGAADLSEVKAAKARFTRANLRSASFAKAELADADLKDARLEKADLTLSDLARARLFGAVLSEAITKGTFFEGASFNHYTVLPFSSDEARALGMDLATSDLVLNLDAAVADGYAAHPAGCAGRRWNDLSATGMDGMLVGFENCSSASGWAGDGTPAEPFRLQFRRDFQQYVKVQANRDIDVKDQLTMLLLYRPRGDRIQALLEYNSGSSLGVHLWQYDNFSRPFLNLIDRDLRGHAVMGSPNLVTANEWHLQAATYDGMLGTLYLDGAEVARDGQIGRVTLVTDFDFYVGYRVTDPNASFEGDVAEVRIYNRALSAAELLAFCRDRQSRYPLKCRAL